MTTATVEGKAEQTENIDPFRYFVNGREGVQRRFCDIFKREIEARSFGDIMKLCQAAEVNPNEVYKVVRGDYGAVNGEMIEKFSTAFKCNLYDGFGKPVISPDERGRLAKILKATQESVGDLVLMTYALDRLDFD